jgi:hypothetical protein
MSLVMNDTVPRRISKPRLFLMVVIDLVAITLAVGLYLWLAPRDMNAAVIAAVSSLVFGAFFNLVIVLVSLKP